MVYQQAFEYKELFLVNIQFERNLTDNTCKSYGSDLHQFFTFWLDYNKTTGMDAQISTALDHFFVQHFYKKTEKSSLARKISCFKSFEKFIATKGHKLNLQLTRPKIDEKLPTYLTVQEINYLCDNIQDADLPSQRPLRDKAILETLYATGIRCAELLQIRIEHIDFQEKTILITGKGRKQRYVLFGQKAKNKILAYMHGERFLHARNNSILFVNPQGESLTHRTIQMICTMFSRFLPVKKRLTPHKIRHSFATHLLNAGLDLRALQELLGHACLSSTEKYTHVTTTDLQAMYNRAHPIDEMLKS